MTKLPGTIDNGKMPLPLHQDFTTHTGAHILAARIRAYWDKRGRHAGVYVTQDLASEKYRGEGHYVVRSNMVGGWP